MRPDGSWTPTQDEKGEWEDVPTLSPYSLPDSETGKSGGNLMDLLELNDTSLKERKVIIPKRRPKDQIVTAPVITGSEILTDITALLDAENRILGGGGVVTGVITPIATATTSGANRILVLTDKSSGDIERKPEEHETATRSVPEMSGTETVSTDIITMDDEIEATMRIMYNLLCRSIPIAFGYHYPVPPTSLDGIREPRRYPQRVWEDNNDDEEFVRVEIKGR